MDQEEKYHMMTRQQASEWCKRVQEGTYEERMWYLKMFGAGTAAIAYWDDGTFTLGIEYGILIALTKAFDLAAEDIGGSVST